MANTANSTAPGTSQNLNTTPGTVQMFRVRPQINGHQPHKTNTCSRHSVATPAPSLCKSYNSRPQFCKKVRQSLPSTTNATVEPCWRAIILTSTMSPIRSRHRHHHQHARPMPATPQKSPLFPHESPLSVSLRLFSALFCRFHHPAMPSPTNPVK